MCAPKQKRICVDAWCKNQKTLLRHGFCAVFIPPHSSPQPMTNDIRRSIFKFRVAPHSSRHCWCTVSTAAVVPRCSTSLSLITRSEWSDRQTNKQRCRQTYHRTERQTDNDAEVHGRMTERSRPTAAHNTPFSSISCSGYHTVGWLNPCEELLANTN